ncbi:MAG: hypothetical protein JO247_18090 [Chloroflexi bacterium]|nr:hypothetical protein [Chloroflexota bacterium]
MDLDDDRRRVAELLGARDLIKECEEMLRGERAEFTEMQEYIQRRLAYWQGRFDNLDLRRGADRRLGERRREPERVVAGRRDGVERREAS